MSNNLVGNIYKGKICNYSVAMDTYFVDIGREQRAIIKAYKKLNNGESILCQVIKEEKDGKGAEVTSNLTFSTDNIVVLTSNKSASISQKITISRNAVLEKANSLANLTQYGIIVRENGANLGVESLLTEAKGLISIYEGIKQKMPSYKIGEVYKKDTVSVEEPIYPYIERLPTGGNIIIEKTTAMIVVDVNSGSFSAANTALLVNKEALESIFAFIQKFRINAIIMIDLIKTNDNLIKKELMDYAVTLSSKDTGLVEVVEYSKLGLLSITRANKR